MIALLLGSCCFLRLNQFFRLRLLRSGSVEPGISSSGFIHFGREYAALRRRARSHIDMGSSVCQWLLDYLRTIFLCQVDIRWI